MLILWFRDKLTGEWDGVVASYFSRVISIIGVLVALLLPAVQGARESARRTQCVSNLRQLALGAELHHDAYGSYPPARIASRPDDEIVCAQAATTWLVRILPFIEEQPVRDEWDLYSAWFDHSDAARNPTIPLFTCPSRRSTDQAFTERAVGTEPPKRAAGGCGCAWPIPGKTIVVTGASVDYAGNQGDLSPGSTGQPTDFYFGGNGTGVLISSRPDCKRPEPEPVAGELLPPFAIGYLDRVAHRNITDGLSKTVIVGEKHIPTGKLRMFPEDAPAFDGSHMPAASRVAGSGVPLAKGPNDSSPHSLMAFGSSHAGICLFAFADGSVRPLDTDTSTQMLSVFSHRSNPR